MEEKYKVEEEKLQVNGKTVEQNMFLIKTFTAMVVVGILTVILTIAGGIYPYAPYTFYGWTDIPETICPLQPIGSGYVSKVEAGPYRVGTITGDAFVLNEKGAPIEGLPVLQDLEPHEKREAAGLVERTAPPYPGEFRFGFTAKVTGYVFGFVPRYQEINYVSKDTFTVLPEQHPQCRSAER